VGEGFVEGHGYDLVLDPKTPPANRRLAMRRGSAGVSSQQTASMSGSELATLSSLIVSEVNRGKLFAFAGLWEAWNDPSGKALETCSILTTTANALTVAVHDRMRGIFDPERHDLWLDPRTTNPSVVSEFLKQVDARLMTCFPVDSRVIRTANDDAECAAPVEIVQPQGSPFSWGEV
jgi:hypothetical protein